MTDTLLEPISNSEEQDGFLDWRAFSRAILNAIHSGIFVLNASGKVIISNKIVQKYLGLYPGSQLNATYPDFWQTVAAAMENRKYRTGIPLTMHGASFMARIGPMIWRSSMIGALCILDDVTELEQTTSKLNSFQSLIRELDTIIDASSDGLWICDGQANVLRLNPASERINGVKATEVVGRNMKDLQREGFVDRSVTLEVIETGKKFSIIQRTKVKRKLMLTGNPVFDAQGRIVRVVVTEQDITEIDQLRKELEEREAMQDQFRHQMLEMQLSALEAHQIVAESPSFIKVLQQALRVSRVDSTVLILGESGTGKGVVADYIHKYSSRTTMPMIKLNCGAIPESLVESELFGYEKGAFTGAGNMGKPGHIELADKGILFLDEIGELPLSSQVKLLRFLEDGHVYRIGGTRARKVDVRVICATNRNLDTMVTSGQFRRDLYYRLNVIPLRIPPLRERPECILPLLKHYIDHFRKKHDQRLPLRFSPAAMEALLSYSYPGNVRELINICERLTVMTDEPEITLKDLPSAVRNLDLSAWAGAPDQSLGSMTLAQILQSVERQVLMEAKHRYRTQKEIARALGVNQSTIARKQKQHGLLSE
jgi:PAS domain S-box-containing protein